MLTGLPHTTPHKWPIGLWMDADAMLPRARYDAVEWQTAEGMPSMALCGWVPAN